ncbi:MAG: 23S rRNA (guanosine(2251)-2'-O)-methyltransferase RlmB [Armatimonadetes bacterium CG07_land_8_20_14_0_80_40_9]|nr:MAG: 23S rRNA (guanosine(2251)-2'-O)-methyltransferase RlmB [Armatimonadetes bacterium CG07_land_8_20_14_0_80_40_9]
MSEFIFGRNPVLEALRSNRPINKILVAKNIDKNLIVQKITNLAKARGLVVQQADRRKLNALANSSSHQGILALVSPYGYVEIEEILRRAKDKGKDPFIIILDGIEDPHNLGAILRSAEAGGVDGVVIPKRRSVGLTAVVAKASAGAIEYVPLSRVTNLSSTLEDLKKQGVWIVGLEMGEKDLWQSDLTGPLALVIGGEGRGISKKVLKRCDFLVGIPMQGKIPSLNASVAASLLIFEVARQRHSLECRIVNCKL